MQLISSNCNWENGVKQIKITEKKLSQSCILGQLLKTKTLASKSKCIKHFFCFYCYLPYICWVDVIYLRCLVFLKSSWLFSLHISCSNPLNYENRASTPSKYIRNIWSLIKLKIKTGKINNRKFLWKRIAVEYIINELSYRSR